MIRRAAVVSLLCVALAAVVTLVHAESTSGKKRRPLPYEFGRVVMTPAAEKPVLAPVVFEHWLHRAKYTCRVCHVDIGFAMSTGGTNITPADNAAGYYCGACHNGRTVADGERIFESCSDDAKAPRAACVRCHSQGKDAREVKPKYDFASFTKKLPKGRFGNGVDWEKAEEEGLVKPADFLEGVSIPRAALAAQKDFALTPEQRGMPEILFSHAKHTVWNGCELCHPEIFGGVKRGAVKYTMSEIFEGKYCGACHVSVAFPLQDCQRCHTKPVQ